MAPSFLKRIDRHGVPFRAGLMTIIGVWIMLTISFFLSSHQLYANLLAISGFTGSICWISICWSQLRFRRRLKTKHIKDSSLIFKIPFFPYLTHFAIWIQVFCLFVVLLSPHLRASFYFGVPALVVPMLLYKFGKKYK